MDRLTDLRCKEVVNIADGSRLGYVSDVEIDVLTGRVVAIIIPGPCRFFGLFGRGDDYVVPWGCIRRFGADIILVEISPEKARTPRKRKKWV